MSATLSAAPSLAYEKDGQLVEPFAATGEGLCPVEFLLLSAAGCMALSVKAAALAAGKPLSVIRVTAAATKCGDAPSRLSDVDLQIALVPALTHGESAQLIAAAQQLCTVTNTVRDSARLAVRIDPAALSYTDRTHPTPLSGDHA